MDSEMEVAEDSGWRLPRLRTAMIKLRDAALVAVTIALLLYAATTVLKHAAEETQLAQHQPAAAIARCDDGRQGTCDKP